MIALFREVVATGIRFVGATLGRRGLVEDADGLAVGCQELLDSVTQVLVLRCFGLGPERGRGQ